MKSFVIFALLCVGAFGAPIDRSLQDDIGDFGALIPSEKMLALSFGYLQSDAEVQQAFEYLQSDEFSSLFVEFNNDEVTVKLIKYFEDQGLQVIDSINKIGEFLGLPKLPPLSARSESVRKGSGIAGLANDILAIIPADKVKALFEDKLKNSKSFQSFVQSLQSPELLALAQAGHVSPAWIKFDKETAAHGLDIHKGVNLVKEFLGL